MGTFWKQNHWRQPVRKLPKSSIFYWTIWFISGFHWLENSAFWGDLTGTSANFYSLAIANRAYAFMMLVLTYIYIYCLYLSILPFQVHPVITNNVVGAIWSVPFVTWPCLLYAVYSCEMGREMGVRQRNSICEQGRSLQGGFPYNWVYLYVLSCAKFFYIAYLLVNVFFS